MTAHALVACASFKGTLSSFQAGQAIAKGLKDRHVRCEAIALADGGEGLVEALARAIAGARRRQIPCRGPLQERRKARIALLPKTPERPRFTVVIEMAASSGLPLLAEEKRDPKITTTLGVGDQIKAALDLGAKEILLGIGGSATNDGGAGMAQALGARLLDAAGNELGVGGAALLKLAHIDCSSMDPRLKDVRVTVACDVDNPLCGEDGASAVFGPQKGASLEDVTMLDQALQHYAGVISRDLGRHVLRRKGAGAAGGLGAGCLAFLNAELRPGIELVLDALQIERAFRGKDFVITGEGLLDRQTLMGKAPAGIAKRARKAGLPCMAIGGGIAAEARAPLKRLFADIAALSVFAGSSREAMTRAPFWLRRLAREKADAWQAIARKRGERNWIRKRR